MTQQTVQAPVHASNLKEYVVDGDVTVFDPGTGNLHLLNEAAAVVWRLCDGTRSTEELIEDVSIVYDMRPSEVEADVRALLDRISRANLLTMARRPV